MVANCRLVPMVPARPLSPVGTEAGAVSIPETLSSET